MNKRKLIFWALIACLLVLLPALGDRVLGAEPRGLEIAKAAQARHTDNLLQIPGVVGTAIGLDESGEAVVDVFVEHPGVGGIPGLLDGVKARVHVTGKIYAQADPTASFPRPVPIGVSSGSDRLFQEGGLWYCSTGTLGARVVDNSGKVYALSNNHVYAQENIGVPGDRILQPGRADMSGCGTEAEILAAEIGKLHSYVAIVFSDTANNYVDAAIGLLTDATQVGTATPDDGYGTPSSTIVNAALNQPVQKYGRTTGMTRGTVTGINATVLIGYSSGTARFVDQVIVSGKRGAFSRGGDSGSLIVTQTGNNPVALLFAGSNTITIGNPIGRVLDLLNVSIDTDVQPDIAPDVQSIEPNWIKIGTTASITISGSGFVSGASVAFEGGSGQAPRATNVSVSDDGKTITATVSASKKGKAATWDVRVTNPDGLSDVLAGAFAVTR